MRLTLFGGLLLGILLVTALQAQVKVYVHLDTSMHTSFSGRLILLTQNDTSKRFGQVQGPQVSFAKNITNWQPGEVQVFDDAAETNGPRLSAMKPGYYRAVAVMHANQEERAQTQNPGNAYTTTEYILHIPAPGEGSTEQHVTINAIMPARRFRESASIKELVVKSNLLTAFHKKDVFMKAAVVLPDTVEPGRKYPVVFIIPGWGGTHFDVVNPQMRSRYGIGQGKKKIYVYLNPETQTRWGLHAFVDSDVNGPWGKALVEELVPALQKNYPAAVGGENYFVMGQSSGGYGALWLQLNYPGAFNGCWAVSPDPVDFSEFTGVNLYEPGVNMYTNAKAAERGLFIVDGKPNTTIREMVTSDEFTGDGGQFQSFEAEFGKPAPNGRPKQVFDRKTGKINPAVVEEWKPYDMALFIQREWPRLAGSLQGKVHVYAGDKDNFLLDKAVSAFAAKARSVNANVTAELIPGADHWSIWSPAFTSRVQAEIDARIR